MDYDVLIAGGGMVGALLAAALATPSTDNNENHPLSAHGRHHQMLTRPLRIGVLESQRPPPFAPGDQPAYGIRVSALSVAAQHMLHNVGAWRGVVDRRACPFARMAVWDGEAEASGGRTTFNAADIGAEALGHIVENNVLQLSLLDRIEQAANVTLHCPARLASLQAIQNGVAVRLDSGEQLTARLLVGADGAASEVREQAGINMDRSAYPQQALVATISTELPQQDITWQRFMPEGPQAFLPLEGSRASMVWYHTPEEVERLVALDDATFVAALESAFPEELGGVVEVLERGTFPIARAHAEAYIAPRLALIGDAAHTVHPLAGQGVNLGLLDAGVLADVILSAAATGRDIGERRVLRRYERWRRPENALMINVLDGFYQAFKPRPKSVQRLRSAALSMADRIAPIRLQAMRHAMGVSGDLPPLARASFT